MTEEKLTQQNKLMEETEDYLLTQRHHFDFPLQLESRRHYSTLQKVEEEEQKSSKKKVRTIPKVYSQLYENEQILAEKEVKQYCKIEKKFNEDNLYNNFKRSDIERSGAKLDLSSVLHQEEA